MKQRHRRALKMTIKLQPTLKLLMKAFNVNQAVLGRETNIPPGTLNRILRLGGDALISTVISLAKYFDVTVGQLIGEETIDFDILNKDPRVTQKTSYISVPIIIFGNIANWLETKNINLHSGHLYVTTDQPFSKGLFATFAPPGTELLFGQNSLMVIDLLAELKNNIYVLASIDGNQPSIYKTLAYGKKFFLRHFIPSVHEEIITINEQNKIIGVIIESRINFY